MIGDSPEAPRSRACRRAGRSVRPTTRNSALLGVNSPASAALGSAGRYGADIDPGISTEFATAAYRLGHSMLGGDIGFLAADGTPVREELVPRDAFFNVGAFADAGVEPILKYLASDRSQEIDTTVVDDVRNFLFGPPGAGGFDLAALNIQRGGTMASPSPTRSARRTARRGRRRRRPMNRADIGSRDSIWAGIACGSWRASLRPRVARSPRPAAATSTGSTWRSPRRSRTTEGPDGGCRADRRPGPSRSQRWLRTPPASRCAVQRGGGAVRHDGPRHERCLHGP